MGAYVAWSWTLVLGAWASIAAFAFYAHVRLRRRAGKAPPLGKEEPGQIEAESVEEFLTARGSAGAWMLGCSLYAGMMGAWAISVPATYAAEAGALGTASYAGSEFLAVLLLPLLGVYVRRQHPSANSLPDVLLERFAAPDEGTMLRGQGMSLLVAAVSLINMCIPMLAEFVTVSSLFRSYLGTVAWPAVAILGLLTTAYTAAGGLAVSLLTDRVQMCASMLMLLLLVSIVVSTEYDTSLSPMTAELQGFTPIGYSSLLSMPLCLATFVLFNEGMWQRVWASASERDLWLGAAIGATLSCATVALVGLGSLLAIRNGRTNDLDDPNLFFFALFTEAGGSSWIGVVVLMLGCIMSMAALDSLQLGIQGVLSTVFLRGHSLASTRCAMLAVNIPLIALAAFDLVGSALGLFLLEAMVTCCCAFPVVLAVLPLQGVWRAAYTEGAALSGIAGGALCLSLYGCWQAGWGLEGLRMAWYANEYAWDYFLVLAAFRFHRLRRRAGAGDGARTQRSIARVP